MIASDGQLRVVATSRPWLGLQLPRNSRSSWPAEDIRFALGIWPGLIRFIGNGRLELDSNAVENYIRPIALTRKNAQFADHEIVAENWAMLTSLIDTCKMSDVIPIDYIGQTECAILDGHPRSRIEALIP
jgi:transposase